MDNLPEHIKNIKAEHDAKRKQAKAKFDIIIKLGREAYADEEAREIYEAYQKARNGHHTSI